MLVGRERLKDCAEDSAESPRDDRCERMASARVELGFAGCEAEENRLVELKTGAEALEKLEPEAADDFGELLIFLRLAGG